MPYNPKAIANYFIRRGLNEGVSVEPMKLQKLVYYAHGWHLAVVGEPLIDEYVEAWQYGPVIPTLYHEFKRFGRSRITEPAHAWDQRGEFEPEIDPSNEETLAVLDRVWVAYKGFSGLKLSSMTHAPGTPWSRAREQSGAEGKKRGQDIPDEWLWKYFAWLAQRGEMAS